MVSVTPTTHASVLRTTDNYDEPTVLDKHTMVSVTQTTHASYGLLIIMMNLLYWTNIPWYLSRKLHTRLSYRPLIIMTNLL